MLLLYALTIFVSATLLFLVQPMVGKMLLPLLGGTPAVWNTCMVFFQAVLLAGYSYAHASTSWLGVRRQAVVQLLLLPAPFLVLPLHIGADGLAVGGAPALTVLLVLSLSVGLPFFVLSTSAPVLQKWFADSGHPSARDPYFLYGASNLGSMLALLSYPLLVEPNLSLRGAENSSISQTHLWMLGYGVLCVLYLCCAVALWRSAGTPAQEAAQATPEPAVTGQRRLRWVLLAFVPSSLLLGSTTYLTTDVAAIPLLWVVPLAVYLLSFILVFGRMPAGAQRLFVRLQPFVILAALLVTIAGLLVWFWVGILLHLTLLFVVSMACHGEMARDRPGTGRLTEFYLLMSLGGVLGGAFNGLLAPVLFPTLLEYQLVMVLACLLAPPLDGAADAGPVPPLKLIGVPLLLFVLCLQVFQFSGAPALAVALVVCCVYLRQPVRFGLCVGAVVLAGLLIGLTQKNLTHQRSFFGALRVRLTDQWEGQPAPHPLRVLEHGTTRHGLQWVSDDPALRGEPLAYYHRQGPLGQVFAAVAGRDAGWRIGVVGLGAGAIAAYGKPGQTITFYEIDDLICRIAFDPAAFTYLRDATARGVKGMATIEDVVLGDARLTLEQANRTQEPLFNMLVVDAFSSDAIPMHLITRQALDVYLERLAADGLLVMHFSNRYLKLEPAIANLVRDRNRRVGDGLMVQIRKDEDATVVGKFPSIWVVIARQPLALGAGWRTAEPAEDVGVWTDDFSNLLRVFGR